MIKKNNLSSINPNQIQLSKDNLAQIVQNQKRSHGGGSSSQNFRLSIRPAGTGVTGNGPVTPSSGISKIQFFNMSKAIPTQPSDPAKGKSGNYQSQQQPQKVIKIKPNQPGGSPAYAS